MNFHLGSAPVFQLGGQFLRHCGKFGFSMFRQHVQVDGGASGGGQQFAAVAVFPAPCPAKYIVVAGIHVNDFAGGRLLQHVGLSQWHIVLCAVCEGEGKVAADNVEVIAAARAVQLGAVYFLTGGADAADGMSVTQGKD